MAEFVHYPVLLNETIELLNCRSELVYVDATAGGGGHSSRIAEKVQPDGKLISIDADPDAIQASTEKLSIFGDSVKIVNSNYFQIPEILRSFNIDKITGGILFDLGTSYYQVTTAEKGFSFSRDARLDMRFSPENPLTAYDIVNTYSEEELVKIFREYGEERFSGRIARRILEKRKIKPIETTTELAELVKFSVPKTKTKIHPATRIFQALRIAVNNELENIEKTLNEVIPILDTGARIAVISFHSLEDRLVKNLFKYYSSKCRCPKEQLICECEPPILEVITRKPITPSEEEMRENPPSRSSKLRVAVRV